MNVNEHKYLFKRFHEQLKSACEQLGWKFEENTDVLNRFDVEFGFGFSLDNIEYFVGMIEDAENSKFYASTVVQYHGNRDEPPSEDEARLPGESYRCVETLLGRILTAHWNTRFQWVMESMIPDYDAAETF